MLRKPMAMGLSIKKICGLVVALCKLHNFCIDSNDANIATCIPGDDWNIVAVGGINWHRDSVNMDARDSVRRVDELLDGGDHHRDYNRSVRRHGIASTPRNDEPHANDAPHQQMLRLIEEGRFSRPIVTTTPL
jgi:hypothetical protein